MEQQRPGGDEPPAPARDGLDAVGRLALLSRIGEDLSSTLDTEEAVGRLARHLVPSFGTWCLIGAVDDGHRLRDLAAWHEDRGARALIAQYAAVRLAGMSRDSYLYRALRSGEVVVVPHAAVHIAEMISPQARPLLADLAPRTAYAIPMRTRDRTVGAITLLLGDDRPDLTEDDLSLLVQVADRAGTALENATLYENQRRIAEGLQRAMLTDPVQDDDLLVEVRYQPAAVAAQVGGDWYDAFVQPNGHTVLVIGDVVGHDIHAAAQMGQVRTLLRGIAYTTGDGPAAVLTALDDALESLVVEAMATATVLRVERTGQERAAGTARLHWSNAGHPPTLLVSPDGAVGWLRTREAQPMLGLGCDLAERTGTQVTVPAGSTVLMFTDGLIERRGEHLGVGLDRLRDRVRELVADRQVVDRAGLVHLVDGVLAGLAPTGAGEDDVALLAAHLVRG